MNLLTFQKPSKKIWLPEEIKLIFKLKKRGLTYKQIGEIFFVSPNSIYKTFKRYNPFLEIKEGSFLWGLQLFNLINKNKIYFNLKNVYYIFNQEIYSKISILIIINEFFFRHKLPLIQ